VEDAAEVLSAMALEQPTAARSQIHGWPSRSQGD
jgi:hypothetical protein